MLGWGRPASRWRVVVGRVSVPTDVEEAGRVEENPRRAERPSDSGPEEVRGAGSQAQ